jgi:hypothetical protein
VGGDNTSGGKFHENNPFGRLTGTIIGKWFLEREIVRMRS